MTNLGQTDIGASREAREQMDESLWWKPEAGEGNRWKSNIIRILPPHTNMEGKFYFGVPIHFKIGPGSATVPCPRKAFQLPCPICAKGFELMNKGLKDDAREFLPSWQAYMNVIPLDENGEPQGRDPKVRVLSASRKVLDEILDIMETKYGDVTDLEEGRNINIRKRVRGGDKMTGTDYQVSAAAEPSAFDHPELVEGLQDLGRISPFRSAEILAGLLEGGAVKTDPFGDEEEEPRPALTGLIATPGSMVFDSPLDDETDAAQDQMREEEAEPAPPPARTTKAAREALKESLVNTEPEGS